MPSSSHSITASSFVRKRSAELRNCFDKARKEPVILRGTCPLDNSYRTRRARIRFEIDQSVQPFGLVIPPGFKLDRKWRLDAWFHGRSENLSEVNFIYDGNARLASSLLRRRLSFIFTAGIAMRTSLQVRWTV